MKSGQKKKVRGGRAGKHKEKSKVNRVGEGRRDRREESEGKWGDGVMG